MPSLILIVEDDALIAADLDSILEDAGYEVAGVAANMNSALAIAERCSLDAAIMDVDLADGDDGVETARLLRERHDVSSLFVSARLSDEVRAMAEGSRPIGFIGKPYSPNAILKALRASG